MTKQTGRQERFLALLEPRLEDLSRFCLAMTRDPEGGKDLMGDVILAAFEGFDTLREEAAFLSYLFTIARRTFHRRRRREKIFSEYDEVKARTIAAGGSPVWIGADVRALYEALAQLPEAQREAIVLFEITGLSLKEVAEVQDASLSAVKSRLARGRERLARLLGVPGTETQSEEKPSAPQQLPPSHSTIFST